ncbi:hypothetical protein JCM10207_002844 [Rhodosporidiobolus poonsookiae]
MLFKTLLPFAGLFLLAAAQMDDGSSDSDTDFPSACDSVKTTFQSAISPCDQYDENSEDPAIVVSFMNCACTDDIKSALSALTACVIANTADIDSSFSVAGSLLSTDYLGMLCGSPISVSGLPAELSTSLIEDASSYGAQRSSILAAASTTASASTTSTATSSTLSTGSDSTTGAASASATPDNGASSARLAVAGVVGAFAGVAFTYAL